MLKLVKHKLEEKQLRSPNLLMQPKTQWKPSIDYSKTITKPPKTFISRPAIMFAKSLTDKLIGLLKYEIISITTINGSNTIGTPLGTIILNTQNHV